MLNGCRFLTTAFKEWCYFTSLRLPLTAANLSFSIFSLISLKRRKHFQSDCSQQPLSNYGSPNLLSQTNVMLSTSLLALICIIKQFSCREVGFM